jgi:hypothetical protein
MSQPAVGVTGINPRVDETSDNGFESALKCTEDSERTRKKFENRKGGVYAAN